MVTKKAITSNGIKVGSGLLIRVGHSFRYEVIQVEVLDISPNGEYVKLGEGIEWFSIKSLKIIDRLKR